MSDDVPRRGRPKVPDDQRRTEKLLLSFTADEMKDLMHAAAGELETVRDYAKSAVLDRVKKK